MRAMWCTLIAVCLVAAGQPHRVLRSHDTTSTLRVASTASHAASRRAPSSQVGPYVAAAAVAAPVPARQLVAYDAPAPDEAVASQLRSPRSSRGPPHA
jgi:hypothetical protein